MHEIHKHQNSRLSGEWAYLTELNAIEMEEMKADELGHWA